MTAWAHPQWPRKKWLARVTPYATAELAADLETTDPRNVPATTVVSVTAESATDTDATFLVVTDGARSASSRARAAAAGRSPPSRPSGATAH